MPISKLHRDVAAIALGAASEHGFALGGGNALIAYGVVDRITQDNSTHSRPMNAGLPISKVLADSKVILRSDARKTSRGLAGALMRGAAASLRKHPSNC